MKIAMLTICHDVYPIGAIQGAKIEKTGMLQSKVSELTGVGKRSIRQIGQEPEVADTDETSFQTSRQLRRPSTVSPDEVEI